MKRKLSGEGSPIAEGPTTLPSSEAQALKATKASVGFNAGFLNKKPQGHFCIRLSTHSRYDTGRKEWVGPTPHQAGESPPPPCRSSWPSQTECPSQPHSWPFIRVGLGIRPGSGDFLAQCHTPGRCPHGEEVQTSPHPHVWAPAQGPREPPE